MLKNGIIFDKYLITSIYTTMKKNILVLNIIIAIIFFTSCKKDDKAVVFIEQSLLDTIFCNTYEGVIPCPDCPGIETSLRIYKDSTISRTIYYQERNELPETRIGTWKRKDSVFIATFDREKLFYKIKNQNIILRVGSDLKEVKGTFAPDYILRKKSSFKPETIENVYLSGDTINLYNKLVVKYDKKDTYNLQLTHFNKMDSLTNCTVNLKATLDKRFQLNAALNKTEGNLRVIFTQKEAHVLFEKIAKDSVRFKCNDSLKFAPFNGSYKKQTAL